MRSRPASDAPCVVKGDPRGPREGSCTRPRRAGRGAGASGPHPVLKRALSGAPGASLPPPPDTRGPRPPVSPSRRGQRPGAFLHPWQGRPHEATGAARAGLYALGSDGVAPGPTEPLNGRQRAPQWCCFPVCGVSHGAKHAGSRNARPPGHKEGPPPRIAPRWGSCALSVVLTCRSSRSQPAARSPPAPQPRLHGPRRWS